MRVVFDFDGVVCYSQIEMLKRLSERIGKEVTVDDWKIYNMHKNFDSETVEKLKPIFSEDIYNGAREDALDKNVVAAMEMLIERGHDVSIETVCANEATYNNKFRYMQNKGLSHINIHPVYGYDKVITADIVVEDCYENLEKADAKIKILITRPWNERFSADKVVTTINDIPHSSLCVGSDEYDQLITESTYIRVEDTKNLPELLKEFA